MKPVVRKGDPTTTGGVVIEGAADSSDMGRPIARKGDWATCPLCPPHGGPIAEGHEQWHIKGRPVALHGHVVACGCPWGSNKVLSTQFEDGVMPGGQGMAFAAKESPPPEPLPYLNEYEYEIEKNEYKFIFTSGLLADELPLAWVLRGAYTVRCTVILNGNNVSISMMMFPSAKAEFTISPWATVTMTTNTGLVYDKKKIGREKCEIWPDDGWIPVGATEFTLPEPLPGRSFVMNIEAGFFADSGSGTIAVPPLDKKTIPIKTVPRLMFKQG